MKETKADDQTSLVEVLKFEIRNVKANRYMTAAEKNAKIKEIQLLAPNHKNWDN